MKEAVLQEVQTLLDDRRKIAKFLREIDRDRQEGWKPWSYFYNHKEAAEFLLEYRREQMAKAMDPHLIAIYKDIEMRLKELEFVPEDLRVHYEKPRLTDTNSVAGQILQTWVEPPPHFYSGKTV